MEKSRLALWRVPGLERQADYPSVTTPGVGWRKFAATRDITVVALCVGRPGEGGRLQVIDVRTGKERWALQVGTCSCLAFSPGRKTAVVRRGLHDASNGSRLGCHFGQGTRAWLGGPPRVD